MENFENEKQKMKLAIIGNGFVGEAIYEGLSDYYEILVHDKSASKSACSIEEINRNAKYVFICVPTPMRETGEIDTTIIDSVLQSIDDDKIIIIKSTITPRAADILSKKYKHEMVFNPEFLTEKTAKEDFKNPSRIVLGGTPEDTREVRSIYEKVFPKVKYIETDHKTACFIKYISNCFSAVKISIMNEFKQIADEDELNWEDSLDGILASGWVNPMHTLVPGPDGKCGFGGKCFPKDINAFISYAEKAGVDPKVLRSSWEKNLELRKDRDWLRIPGATSKK